MIRRGLLPIALTLALLAATAPGAASPDDKKLKVEELVARHVESLGSKEALAAAKSRVATGSVALIVRVGGAGSLEGEGVIASTGNKVRLNMKFPAIEYPGESLAFDGSRAATGFLPSGNRSRLSAFISQQDETIKEGLLGGVLSTAWPLLRLAEQQARLEYKGLKKIGGRELHEVSYRPRKGSADLKILLHFDPATSRHVRTQYSYMISATIGTRQSSNQNPESYYSLTEEFDDFREEGGLMLPHKYRIQVSVQAGTTSSLYDYNMTFSNVAHNQPLDEKIFTLK
jgi:hypothetical protein